MPFNYQAQGNPGRRGRPVGSDNYTPELGEEICKLLETGLSLNAVCKQLHLSQTTARDWLFKHSDFSAKYSRAREIAADNEFESLVDVARTATPQDAQCVKLVIDTMQWCLARKLPRKYGKQVDVTLAGDKERPLVHKFDTEAEAKAYLQGKDK